MRLLIVALVVQLALGAALVGLAVNDFRPFTSAGGGGDSASATTGTGSDGAASGGAGTGASRPDRFDAPRAMRLVREQVGYGPRPAGSAASRRLAVRLRTLLSGHFEAVPGGLRNIVAGLPGRGPAIVLGAHYDTEATIPHHVGANDGAAGTAAVVEVARALRRVRRPADAPALRFVLFDGEEEPLGSRPENFLRDALRGSKAYVRAHGKATREMVLLDYIANQGLRLPREGTSTPGLWERVRAAARRAGAARYFPPGTQTAILDDHTPFLQAGIPAVDLIDFSYRYADTPEDTPDKLSTAALDGVGETIAELLRR
ncbi:MAG: glutaminyl-peptide cyclotransferase [Solirubrobacteraceae bacterium]|nr:glutaminyl-peptide cyclotransferase [Solirubrobacteraceae bacterium]